MSTILGIDLGTTNSEVAACVDGQVKIVSSGYTKMLPSCVGLSPEGQLLVGTAAKNQDMLYPERTALAVKRSMGLDETISLVDRTFSPQEISSFILRELVQWAAAELGETPTKVVITVPAYFSDSQRQATREAGALAGLEVVRIVNEPTAASLAYGHSGTKGTVLVYDLGGGTFDVSVVRKEDEVTEVLASHGNNHLGGNDFTELLFNHLAEEFKERHKVDIRQDHPMARSRLWWAAEEAKKALSEEPFAKIREENLLVENAKHCHMEMELNRGEFEELIRSSIASTMDSVTKALTDAGLTSADLDAILLVGGATRTPLVQEMLRERSPAPIHQEVHPDLCVALGAGMLAAQLAGENVDQALVDITAYSFGISYLGSRGGQPYPHCYKPIINRNCALPLTRTERYFTSHKEQTQALIQVYQGEDPDALRNIPLGDFVIEGLSGSEEHNEILCKMHIDLDGILRVSAIEKETGLTKHITIENTLTPMSESEIQEARKSLEELYGAADAMPFSAEQDTGFDETEGPDVIPLYSAKDRAPDDAWAKDVAEARNLLERSRVLLETMHPDDREEAVDLHEEIESNIASKNREELVEVTKELSEILFYVEGR